MEISDLIDVKHGISGLLVSVCIILSLQLVVKVGEFLWKLKEKKDSASEEAIKNLTKALENNTETTRHLDVRLSKLETSLDGHVKLRKDVRRAFSAVKLVAGDRWPEIMKEILEDETV